MLKFKYFILGAVGAFSLGVNAELIPSNIANVSNQNENLAHRAISANAQITPQPASHISHISHISHTESSILDKLNALAASTVKNFTQSGVASWYGRQFHGRKTANGEIFNMNALTAAHKSLPLDCLIRVTNKSNGKSVVVRVNDRGPFHGNRVVDLSYGAAKVLGIVNTGTANVLIERIPEL